MLYTTSAGGLIIPDGAILIGLTIIAIGMTLTSLPLPSPRPT